MASRVLLGVAMLNETSGMGDSVKDVNEDMVIARGTPSCVAVHTTMGLVSSRKTERSCSERFASASGSDVGAFEGGSSQHCEEADDWKFRVVGTAKERRMLAFEKQTRRGDEQKNETEKKRKTHLVKNKTAHL